ncbi:hypothetical protein Pmar_PMAR009185 [Perkinsus marinus ATCC 50983]|uniref:Uncharacterized protein n=1 Tax=Perkinsus marinus (strain ATCC 50983 / TXsc) TaxID=423536 RepID=C5LE11_PERM5|nr:hypothetical protein Pmar_PMAR009185 [Perkinsus marinus ATCC 50983]EER05009.1 hypothetical protein Pmar_PMAR009185 [Perkinsus marinus ATCC 50983]|eukprot:XP_002773193.1 hypothetical protein Pmar_PMAR009185 [Perkinsus marinus ATCC 50983]
MTDVESDSGKIDYNDHPFNVLNVEDSILRLPFYMGEEYADDVALEEPSRGHGIEVSLKDIITGKGSPAANSPIARFTIPRIVIARR